jgi:hypothetical protein
MQNAWNTKNKVYLLFACSLLEDKRWGNAAHAGQGRSAVRDTGAGGDGS